jgi:hypothetical protein
MPKPMRAVKMAKPQTVSRQPKLSTAQAMGAADRILPSEETPTVSPANVPKIAAGRVRAKM